MKFEEVYEVRNISFEDCSVEVVVAEIAPNNIKEAISLASEFAPLQNYKLNHLKRIQKFANDSKHLSMIVCPVTKYSELQEPRLLELFLSVSNYNVCGLAPQTRSEFEEWGKAWPVIFRPDEISRVRETTDLIEQNSTMSKFVKILREDENMIRHFTGNILQEGAVLVNPIDNKVLMTSFEGLLLLLQTHCNITVNYVNYDPKNSYDESNHENIQEFFKSLLVHPLFNSASSICIEGFSFLLREDEIVKDILPHRMGVYDNYICTGCHMYCSVEPDLSSSMALLHSRIGQVVYCKSSAVGALGTMLYLHCVPELNHHFRVFRLTEVSSDCV